MSIELDSLPDDATVITLTNKNLTYIPDLSRFKKMIILHCGHNRLTSIPYFENLQSLSCENNQLTSLRLNKNLNVLFCSYNRLTCLQLNEKLRILYCSENELTSLDTANLQELYCENNRLTSLRLNENLKRVSCEYNRLTSLPVLNKNLHINYSNNPIYEIINSVDIDIINRKMQVLNNFRYLYYSLKFKKRFRDLLWVKIREPKIRSKYSHKYLVEHLRDTDLDEFLQNW